ncbi:MAG: shikimate kinase [Porticoccaceae bacterium]|jgi:shikimate kinase
MSEQHIFLVGPMGVGKTTVGRQLAGLLHRPFIDVDAEIESRCGADIPWIFDMEGEQGFRERESKVLSDIVANNPSSVIATGGGVVLSKKNRQLLQACGQVIYLSASKEQLYERMRRDKSRPLLQVEDREKVIAELLEVRDPLYREVADIVFSAEGGSSAKVAKVLLEELSKH